MKTRKKKWLASLLAVTMVLAMLQTTAFAADVSEAQETPAAVVEEIAEATQSDEETGIDGKEDGKNEPAEVSDNLENGLTSQDNAGVINALTASNGTSGFEYVYIGSSTNHKDDATATENLGKGTATWVSSTATLTLHNATITDRNNIHIRPTSSGQTVTIVLEGDNSIEVSGIGILASNGANLIIKAETGASLSLDANGTVDDAFGIVAEGSITFSGGSYRIAADSTAISAGTDLVITDGANFESIATGTSAIVASGSITVSGEGTVVNADDAYYCVMLGWQGVTISDGAKVSGSSQNDSAVYAGSGNITVSDAEISLTALTKDRAAFLVADEKGALIITNSTLEVSSGGVTLYSKNKIEIDDSTVNAKSTGSNAIKSASASGQIRIENSVIDVSSPENTNGIYAAGNDAIIIDDSWVSTTGSETFENNITDSVLINGNEGTVIGNAMVPGDVEIPAGTTVTIPEGTTLTVPEGVILTKVGTIEGEERFANNGTVNCKAHQLVKVNSKAATCTEAGNNEYWTCSVCGRLFSDEAGTTETTIDDITISATDHSYGAEWKSNETNHWHECTCGEKTNEAAHTLEWVIDKEATATEKGSKHQECSVCGYKNDAVSIPATGETSHIYQIIEGANGSWTQNTDGTLTFRANGSFNKFTGIKVDGKTIGSANYTAESGSTVITLKADYLKTLSAGEHKLTVVFNDGECNTNFTVKAAQSTDKPTQNNPNTGVQSPQTGDSSNMALWIILLAVSVLGFGGALLYGRKRRISR